MAKNRACLAILLVGLAVAYIFSENHYVLIFLILSAALPLISFAMLFIAQRTAALELNIDEYMQKSGTLTYSFKKAAAFPPVRFMLSACLLNLMSGAQITRRVYGSAAKRCEVTLYLSNACVGRLVLETRDAALLDCFGVFRLKLPAPPARQTLVMPDMAGFTANVAQPQRIGGDGEKYSPIKPGSDVSEMFALREYAAGDDLRRVHWKLSSKLDKLLVRDFSLPLNYSVFLLMDIEGADELAIDLCAEALLSCSADLLARAIPHSIAWFDHSSMGLATRDIADAEQLALVMPELLSATRSEDTSAALRLFAQMQHAVARRLTILYFTTDPHFDDIAALALSHDVTVMRAGSEGRAYPDGFKLIELRGEAAE